MTQQNCYRITAEQVIERKGVTEHYDRWSFLVLFPREWPKEQIEKWAAWHAQNQGWKDRKAVKVLRITNLGTISASHG